ncbi:MAG: hypothetical protein HC905_21720 [Bacteroidales bacterium]|nr:hypothetical protein [Bacteroidales bacterium]
MSSKKGNNPSSNSKKIQDKVKPVSKTVTAKRDFLDIIDAFFSKRLKFFFWFGIGFTTLFAFLLFES